MKENKWRTRIPRGISNDAKLSVEYHLKDQEEVWEKALWSFTCGTESEGIKDKVLIQIDIV